MSRVVYDKDGNKITIADSNDLSHKTNFTALSNMNENIGSNVIERVIEVLKVNKPIGLSIITVYGATVIVIGDATTVGNGYGAYLAFHYYDSSIYLIKVQNGEYTYRAIS